MKRVNDQTSSSNDNVRNQTQVNFPRKLGPWLASSLTGMALASGLSLVALPTLAGWDASHAPSVGLNALTGEMQLESNLAAPSRFLWEEESQPSNVNRTEPAEPAGVLPFTGMRSAQSDSLSAYTGLMLCRFLWEGSGKAARNPQEIRQETPRLARYLWDEPSKAGSQLARYLWDEPSKAGSQVARYLWDEPSKASPQLARYLWDEPSKAAPQPSRYLWDEASKRPMLAHFLWREFAPVDTSVEVMDGSDLRALTIQDQNLMAYGDLRLAAIASSEQVERVIPAASEVPRSVSARAADRVNAHQLHAQGITGRGVGIAVIDTGLWDHAALTTNSDGEPRVKVFFDATENEVKAAFVDDQGHGSHIASVLASSRKITFEQPEAGSDQASESRFEGIAPDADLIIVKAFDDQSQADYVDVVRAIDFVINHREQYNIKVLNLAFQGQAMTHYWDDPINQAVMAAWNAGIAVVVSSGNSGPGPMTMGAPANVPYVITVGAMTDAYTPGDVSDDYLAPFSAFGPTLEGFAKPEMVAPGGHLSGLVPAGSTLSATRPEFHQQGQDYLVSGTSQAAAVVSGLAALALQAEPWLTPDDLKCRLMMSSQGHVAGESKGQGTGLVDGVRLLASRASGCANQGLDLAADIARTQRFIGPYRSFDADARLANGAAIEPFNRATALETADWSQTSYIDIEMMHSLGFRWSEAELKDRNYWVDQAKLPAPGAFASHAPLEGKVLAGLMHRLIPMQAFDGTQLDPLNSAGFIWNLAAPESAGFIWNLAAPESSGFIWNLAAPESAGFIWNLAAPESAGFIWNLAAPESAGFIWNLAAPESAGFIWNLAAPESAGFIWNLAAPESAGFIWNL